MSRRPPAAGADRTEQNRATLKQLVKLESNKSCADCKRNKHPRWASWNLGVFVCIRCSGIHRGMGTHVSRVKSVDLDSWTDEQLQNMLRWGNARANKYWESKLAEGHVPNEAKIENFIRTKYDSKRWVMDGPMPDPATLDVAGEDDDMPLKMVQERARSGSGVAGQRNGSAPLPQPPRSRPQEVDLFGDEPAQMPARPNTVQPSGSSRMTQAKAPVAPPKQTKPGESLLGLDFFGGAQSAAPARPSSTGPSASTGRTDLKQSILSLYASKPAAPSQQQSSNANAFGGMQSPPLQSPQSNTQSLGGLDDAFGSLSFSSQQSQPKAAPFSNLASPTGHSRQPSMTKSSLSGGGFFDSKPAAQPKPTSPPVSQPTHTRQESFGFGNDFGDFSSAASPVASTKSPPPASNSMGDLFDLASPGPPPPPKPVVSSPPPVPVAKQPPPINYSAFNLSKPSPASPPPTSKPAPVQKQSISGVSGLSNMDAWGSNDAWATPDPAPAPAAAPAPKPAPIQSNTNAFKPAPAMSAFDNGWGDEPAKPASNFGASSSSGFNNTTTSAGGFSVQQDEEFGGWSHASPIATTASTSTSTAKPAGGIGNTDDLFGNVWE